MWIMQQIWKVKFLRTARYIGVKKFALVFAVFLGRLFHSDCSNDIEKFDFPKFELNQAFWLIQIQL